MPIYQWTYNACYLQKKSIKKFMHFLNCGCGQRFHSNWINIDHISYGKEVFACDLRQGIQFPDQSFDAVYHAHFLEHLTKSEGVLFVQECFRVLKSGGILRVVVPDLEQIVRSYLFAFEQACAGSEEWAVNYEWMMLELYDQTVRNYSGGVMADYLLDSNVKNKTFIIERIGQEAEYFFKKKDRKDRKKENPTIREWLIKKILGTADYSALKIGRFRQNGEIHQWMYDLYSLSNLLKKCGFVEIQQRKADESLIKNWIDFQLDADRSGVLCKPDSIYIEAVKGL